MTDRFHPFPDLVPAGWYSCGREDGRGAWRVLERVRPIGDRSEEGTAAALDMTAPRALDHVRCFRGDVIAVGVVSSADRRATRVALGTAGVTSLEEAAERLPVRTGQP